MDAIDEAMRQARASNGTLRAALKDTISMTDEQMARQAIEQIVDRALTPDAMAAELRRLGYGVTEPKPPIQDEELARAALTVAIMKTLRRTIGPESERIFTEELRLCRQASGIEP